MKLHYLVFMCRTFGWQNLTSIFYFGAQETWQASDCDPSDRTAVSTSASKSDWTTCCLHSSSSEADDLNDSHHFPYQNSTGLEASTSCFCTVLLHQVGLGTTTTAYHPHLPASLSVDCHIHGPVPHHNTALIAECWSPWHSEWKNLTWQHECEQNGSDKQAKAPGGHYIVQWPLENK